MGIFSFVKNHIRETISLYDDLLYSLYSINDSNRTLKIPKVVNKFNMDSLGSYNMERVTYYYLINRWPRVVPLDYRDTIRSNCSIDAEMFVNFCTVVSRHKVQWTAPEMQSRLHVLGSLKEEQDGNNVNAYNMYNFIDTVTRQEYIEDSLTYLAEADKVRGREIARESTMMIITGNRSKEFDACVNDILEYCERMDFELERVLFDIPDTLKYYSPLANVSPTVVKSGVSFHVMSDEILARHCSYAQGTTGYNGIYFGTDILSYFPVRKIVKRRNDDAETWLITGETGSGKSSLIKPIIFELLGKNYRGTIMDIEGFEYIPLANYVSHESDVLIINMAEGQGNYFDPVEIPQPTGDIDIDKTSKKMSINFTTLIFRILLGTVYDEDSNVAIALDDTIDDFYASCSVTDNTETWKNTKGKSLHDVFSHMLRMENFRRDNSKYTEAVRKCVAKLSKYFDPIGSCSSIFKHKITVSDVAEASLVVCSFGLAGKTEQMIDVVQRRLMEISAAGISYQRSIFGKLKNRINFTVWEEIQRWGKFAGSKETLGTAITGGRKLGNINIISTNDPKELLMDDKFELFENLQSFFIGAIADEKVRHDICQRLSVMNFLPELNEIAKASLAGRDTDTNSEMKETLVEEESVFRHAFLCGLDRSKYAITKFFLPNELLESTVINSVDPNMH